MPLTAMTFPVIPAKAGIQSNRSTACPRIPAFAGMTDLPGER